MKKRERICRWTAALTAALTAASVGTDSAAALPAAKHEDGLDFATVWEMSLNTTKNAELQKEQLHELLEKRFGVEDETELTFSEPYYWYYNFNEFAADEDLYTYFVFQDGELLGEISLLSNGDFLSASTIPADSVLRTLVENGSEFWLGSTLLPMVQNLVYADGTFYDVQGNAATDYVLGEVPYYSYSAPAENPTEATEAPEQTTSVGAVGDVNLDGAIDLADAVLLNKAVSGSVVLATDVQKTAADCNRDGVLSAEDGVELLGFLVRQVDAL
mgnify:FL=1